MAVILPPRAACDLSPFMFSAALTTAMAKAGVEGAQPKLTSLSAIHPAGAMVLVVAEA